MYSLQSLVAQSKTLASAEAFKWVKFTSLSAVDKIAPLMVLRSSHDSTSKNIIRNREYKYAFTGLYPRKLDIPYPICTGRYLNMKMYTPSIPVFSNSKLSLVPLSPHNLYKMRGFSSQRKEEPNPFKAHAFDYDIYEKSFQVHGHEKGPWKMILKEVEALYHLYKHGECGKKMMILSLAAGPGELPIILAQTLPEAHVYSTDISVRMVESAANKAKELKIKNISSLILDMEDMSQFEDQSFDLISCCYGLAHVKDIQRALNEMHRVLKPGGTVVLTVWEHLSTEPIIDSILNAICQGHEIPTRTIDPTKLSTPYELEDQIEKCGMKVIKVLHEEYPFLLPSIFEVPNDAFAFTTLYAKEELGKLVRSGTNPYAFEDAHKTFDDIVLQGVMARNEGRNVVMEGNRYKMIVARRSYENGDTLKIMQQEGLIGNQSSPGTTSSLQKVKDSSTKGTRNKEFDDKLIEVYSRTNSIPWCHIVTSVKRLLQHHDMHQVNILDLASARGQLAIMMAQVLPEAAIHAVDISPDLIDQANKAIRSKGLMNVHASVGDVHDLRSFQDASFDIITCSFALPFFDKPQVVLHEVHRLLKPGGSLVTANWETLAIDQISDIILKQLVGKGDEAMKDRIIDPLSYSAPRKVEALIEESDLSIVNVDHEEFHLKLTGESCSEDFSFQAAVGSIRTELNELVTTRKNPNAFLDARVIFEKLLQDRTHFKKDHDGNFVTASANRYKVMVARRQYEDKDE